MGELKGLEGFEERRIIREKADYTKKLDTLLTDMIEYGVVCADSEDHTLRRYHSFGQDKEHGFYYCLRCGRGK